MTEMLSAPILVVVDAAGAEVSAPSLDLVAGARALTSGDVVALVTGDASACAPSLAAAGVDRILDADVPQVPGRVQAGVAADAVVAAVAAVEPAVVFVTADYRGKEIAGRAAVLMGSACASDVAQVRVHSGAVEASKLVLSGSWSTTIAVEAGAPVPVLAVRAGAFAAEGVGGGHSGAGSVEALHVEVSAAASAVRVVSREVSDTAAGPDLSEARTVVVGGRGVDGDFEMVRSLASSLDAAVGATRVACDEGWIERSAQVGQTGVSIAPRLYIGLGVSGAVHHTSGIQGAGTIVAICDDSEAPIFEMADFGVVGDVREVVPQLLAELERLRA